ncbi:MAG: cytochrome c biogenesis protein ResB [Nitrospiraceae bacterium]|nr:cytochrome c biogenesis protein ResB [Nitrospiraceae bacterium]
MENQQKQKSLSDRIWSFLASIKLAIIVFSLIALTSIVGTVVEQQAAPEKNLKVLGSIFGDGLAPTAYKVLDTLGFMNMYRSWWFLLLLVLFAVNLIICSIDRFPGIWRVVRTPVRPLPPDAFRNMPIKAELAVKAKPAALRESVLSSIRGIGFNAAREDEEGGFQFYAQKHAWSRLGVYITHFSIVVIMLGAVIGIFFGFKGFVNIPEGLATNLVYANTGISSQAEFDERNKLLDIMDSAQGDVGQVAKELGVSVPALTRRLRHLGIVPLGFAVRCDQFDVDYYPNSDMPKAYKSHLTVFDGGKPVLSKWIEVNEPLKYKGVTFYQSSYGVLPDTSGGVAVLELKSAKGASDVERLKVGDSFTIPGTGITGKIDEFNPALNFDEAGNPYTYSPMMTNPAIKVSLKFPDGRTATKWIAKRYPESWQLPDGNIVGLTDFWGVRYTGVQARKDPGVWVVYFGCITLALGLFVAFFVSHRKIWVRVAQDKGGSRITVAASSNKNKSAFERQIEQLKTALLTKEVSK